MEHKKLSKEERRKYVEAYKMIEDFVPVCFDAEKNNFAGLFNRKQAKLYGALRKHLKKTFKENEVITDILEHFPPAWFLRKKILMAICLTCWLTTEILLFKNIPWFLKDMAQIVHIAHWCIWGLIVFCLKLIQMKRALQLVTNMGLIRREIEEKVNGKREPWERPKPVK